jgi:hypothetical protein
MNTKLGRLPEHRYRLNALLARVPGAAEAYRRTSERLWAEARRIDVDALVTQEAERSARARLTFVHTGPARGPFTVDLSIEPRPSPIELRFQAQQLTLESAADSTNLHWGAGAALALAPEKLPPGDLPRLLDFVVTEALPDAAVVTPWCPAMDIYTRRKPEPQFTELLARRRPLRAVRRARRTRMDRPENLLCMLLRGALRALHVRREHHPGRRYRIGVIGTRAVSVAADLASESFLDIQRVADEDLLYAPASFFPGGQRSRELIVVGSFDPAVLEEPVDLLVLLDGAPVVNRETAESIMARGLVEAGTNLVLPEADGTLAGRRIDVVPDLMFATGRAAALRLLLEQNDRPGVSFGAILAAEMARLVRTILDEATAHGRSLREQLYLRALANLRRLPGT